MWDGSCVGLRYLMWYHVPLRISPLFYPSIHNGSGESSERLVTSVFFSLVREVSLSQRAEGNMHVSEVML